MTDAPDVLGMQDAALALPERVEEAARAAAGVDLPEPGAVSAVVFAAAGDDATAAHAVATLAAPSSRVPVVVAPGGDLPGFVGADTLVVAVSWSGGDDEVLDQARQAVGRGARLLAAGSGGALAGAVREHGAPFVEVGGDLPAARCAVVPAAVAVGSVLARLGLIDAALVDAAPVTAQLLRRRSELSADADPAGRIARSVGRTMPLVYGGGPLGAVAARHWKSRCNQDPKVPSFANHVPSLTHDEVAGWAQHGDVTRQVFSLVVLRHDHEGPEVARSLDAVGELCTEVVAGVHEVRAAGDGPLAQLADLLLFGDVVALRMAAQAGVDPGPVPILDDLARTLGSP